MIVDTFIGRPILAGVCSLVIVLAGALAIPNMPIAWSPEVSPARWQSPRCRLPGTRR
jgi:HAE1 family hydrophobic/amphiphilic exporter-1